MRSGNNSEGYKKHKRDKSKEIGKEMGDDDILAKYFEN